MNMGRFALFSDSIKHPKDTRRADLAKIHIAKKYLALDEETYRTIVRTIGKATSGSSADLTSLGRARVLQHFRRCGWKGNRLQADRPKRVTGAGEVLASQGQIGMIRSLWTQMADAGAIHGRAEQCLRAWVRSTTRRYHPQRAGYGAPEFLPDWVAARAIEHLKSWARRCKIDLHEQ